MSLYQVIDEGSVLRLADGARIPADPANRDYAAYLAWAEAGNAADEPPTPPVIVPAFVTNFQARAVLRQTFLPDGRSMETAVRENLAGAKLATAGLPENDLQRIQADTAWLAWEQANEFTRSGPMLNAVAANLGLTSEQIDALFIAAALVEA